MKNKIVVIFIIILFLILLIFSSLIFNDASKISKGKKIIMIEVKNWDLEKKEGFYVLNFNITKNESNDFLNSTCDIHVVDENNNLLYRTTKINFSKQDNYFNLTHVVKYDISKINKIVVTPTNVLYEFDKNLMDKNYIGEKQKTPENVIIDYQTPEYELPKTE